MVTPAVAVPIQGEMVHDIDAAGGLIHDVSVRHSPVETVRRETNEFQCGFTNAVQATSAEVEDPRGIAFAQQELDEAGPDETGSPCDQSLCHFGSLLPRRLGYLNTSAVSPRGLNVNGTRVQFPVPSRWNGTLELDLPAKVVQSRVIVCATRRVNVWPVKDGRARRCPAGRGLREPRVGGPDRRARRPPGPCRCPRQPGGCRPGRGTCRSPSRLPPRGRPR